MRRALIAASVAFVFAARSAALDVPYLSGRVNDDARLLDARAASSLEQKLKDYESRTGRQFAVLTIPSLEGAPLEEFSLKVARTWKLGRKGKDDGILLLVARDDRKVRIEVGDGLEGILTDALCGRIIRDAIVPRFREGDFAGGVTAGVDGILAALAGAPAGPPSGPVRRGPRDLFEIVLFLIFLAAMLQAAFRLAFSLSPAAGAVHFLFMNLLVSGYASNWWGLGIPVFVADWLAAFALAWAGWETDWGRRRAKEAERPGSAMYFFSSSPMSGGSSGGGGFSFSGGGGSFGGGGASGSW